MPRLLPGGFGPKWGPGDWRWTSHSPTGAGPEGSSPNEVRIGSLVSLLPVFSSESRQDGHSPSGARIRRFIPQRRLREIIRVADRSMTDAGASLMSPNVPDSTQPGGSDPGRAPSAREHYRVPARAYPPHN